jgi:tRNA modification GTPase
VFSTTDTIVAIATPPGRGGIGVVRVSGPHAQDISRQLLGRTSPLEPRHATFTRITGVDQLVATYFAAPASYTGEDVVELSAHGSPVLLRTIVCGAMRHGARLARPGEFTLRAFLNGRIDLVQAEAVADLIDAVTPGQARAAFDQLEGTLTGKIGEIDRQLFDLVARLEASLDFPDEGYHFVEPDDAAREISQIEDRVRALIATAQIGRLIREGYQVVIAGKPNAGKSTLFNGLAGADRAIVTATPGTTRDLITERIDIDGMAVTLVDTAGIRNAADDVERIGVARARQARDVADVVLLVLDASRALDQDDRELLADTAVCRRLIVVNKVDLPRRWRLDDVDVRGPVIELSAGTGEGVAGVRPALADLIQSTEPHRDTVIVTNVRHADLLQRALDALERGRDAAGARRSEEFVLADLHEARGALEEITGRRAPDAVLTEIFQRFCIGK